MIDVMELVRIDESGIRLKAAAVFALYDVLSPMNQRDRLTCCLLPNGRIRNVARDYKSDDIGLLDFPQK